MLNLRAPFSRRQPKSMATANCCHGKSWKGWPAQRPLVWVKKRSKNWMLRSASAWSKCKPRSGPCCKSWTCRSHANRTHRDVMMSPDNTLSMYVSHAVKSRGLFSIVRMGPRRRVFVWRTTKVFPGPPATIPTAWTTSKCFWWPVRTP